MSELNNLIGQQFGRYAVLDRAGNTPDGQATWLCRCVCGKEKTIRGGQLRSGHTKSCGCHKGAIAAARHYRHGKTDTPLFGVWKSMRQRCRNPKNKNWGHYGGRGIGICDEWGDFEVFYYWAMSHGYVIGLTIDRIDVDKGYSPDNCRWATWHEQRINQRSATWASL
jgi:hypothetical protein